MAETTPKKNTAKSSKEAKSSVSSGVEAQVYTQEGKVASKVKLPASVFGAKWNDALVHEVVTAMQSNARAGTADTKDRSEVRGGGRKPWRQKGTGRARHGSRRSPIWTGGGVTFGPSADRDFSKKLNKSVKARALASTLSKKYEDGEVLFLDTIILGESKTSEAKKILEALSSIKGNEILSTKKNNNAVILLTARNENVERSFRNFGNIIVMQIKDVSPVTLLTYKHIIVVDPKVALGVLERRVATKSARTPVTA